MYVFLSFFSLFLINLLPYSCLFSKFREEKGQERCGGSGKRKGMSNRDQKTLCEKQIAFNKNKQNFKFCYINKNKVRVLFPSENNCKVKIGCLDDIWSGEVCLLVSANLTN